MREPKRTFDDCLASAKKYATAREWQINEDAVYQCAYYHNWHKEIRKIMGWKINSQKTYEDVKKEASQFTGRKAWSLGNSSSYRYACRKKWQQTIAQELGAFMRGVNLEHWTSGNNYDW